MSTRTCNSLSPRSLPAKISMCCKPLVVATETAFSPDAPAPTRPLSNKSLAKQRMPLPHISLSLPSGFHILMRKSALSSGKTRIKPSPPTPKLRSQTAVAKGESCSSSMGTPSRQSIITKSLPSPCIFTKVREFIRKFPSSTRCEKLKTISSVWMKPPRMKLSRQVK